MGINTMNWSVVVRVALDVLNVSVVIYLVASFFHCFHFHKCELVETTPLGEPGTPTIILVCDNERVSAATIQYIVRHLLRRGIYAFGLTLDMDSSSEPVKLFDCSNLPPADKELIQSLIAQQLLNSANG